MRRALFPILAFVAFAIAGCGGGGGSVPAPAGVPTPHVGPTTIPPTSSPQLVNIAGAGYTLQFTLPALTVGSAATVTASLQATPPAGVPALQALARNPKKIGGTPVGLVYLTLSTTAGVGFASLPSFVWTLPSASVIPPGSSAYMAWYDPAVGQWQTHLGPAAPSGTTVAFPGVSGGFALAANAQYTYALTTNASVVPTASPAPIPSTTPSPAPTTAPAAAAPAYCTQFHSYTGSSAQLNITDDSGLNGTLVVYVETGNGYLNGSGLYSSVAVPLPAICYSTTGTAVSGNPLNIPNPSGGRIVFAYAPGTPNPSSSVPPNPLPLGNETPVFGGTNIPWDKIEYAVPGGIVDTTQVDALGLPIEMSLTSSSAPLPHQTAQTCTVQPAPSPGPVPSIVGFSSCGELNAFNDLAGAGNAYAPLLLAVPFNGSSNAYVTRIYSEKWDLDFQTLYSGSPASSPPACISASTSQMCAVLASYQSKPQLFTSNVSGAGSVSGDWYCASSDGTSNFVFTDVGSAMPSACPTLAPGVPSPAPSPATVKSNPFRMPVALLESAQFASYTINAGACQFNNLFNQPYGLAQVDNQPAGSVPTWYQSTGNLFENNDAFALWKALVADIGYGKAMQAGIGVHPGGAYPAPMPPAYSNQWKDPFYNYYDQVMHHYANAGFAYGTPYDDLYQWESGYGIPNTATAAINIRINPLPVAGTAYAQTSQPPTPTSCPSVPIEVGSW